ncbi:MAG: tRNA (adenosine(37)-N6)-threonylcarbamoyltransferase complex dimerization subunit type 1 TsaB [bacterium]
MAVETATHVCGVALADDDHLVAGYRLNQKNVHNEKLVAAIQCLVKDAKWVLEDLDAIAVSMGPGAFTGLRIGIAVSKGLAFTLGIPLVGVNTLDALAYQAHLWRGQVCSIIKAKEGEIYFALYNRSAETLERCSDYQVINIEELGYFLRRKTLLVAVPQGEFSTLKNNKIVFAPPEVSALMPFTIAKLGHMKFDKKEFQDLESVEPFYLKEFTPKRKVYYGVQ